MRWVIVVEGGVGDDKCKVEWVVVSGEDEKVVDPC